MFKLLRSFVLSAAPSVLLVTATAALAQTAPILQPGPPGQPTRAISPQDAIRLADTRFSPDDVRFMQEMIVHHQQAVDMAALVKGRTNRQPIVQLARRIDASQADEMKFMSKWMTDRGQALADPHASHMMHAARCDQGRRVRPHVPRADDCAP
jgi:uncharacterized protein (DUF305 family)